MRIIYRNSFKKSFDKLSFKLQERFLQNIKLFAIDPHDPRLNNHPLKGTYAGYRSINVGGDLRAIYKCIGNQIVFFVNIGTYSELYDE
jgi:addiction module RelE/StbE family toxin